MIFRKKPPETSRRRAGGFDYKLVRTRRRTLALQIREGELIVRSPHRTPLHEIETWIFEKRRWIDRHLDKSRKKIEARPAFSEGARHPFLGRHYPLALQKGAKTGVDLLSGELVVTLRGDVSEGKIERALKRFYTAEAKTLFEDRLGALFPAFEARGHARPQIRLRWMKSRWGTMSQSGKMTLNTKLVMKDLELIDYVIVHEMCHMEHMNHGPRFYKLMDKMMPGWKRFRKHLKGDL